MRCSRTNYVRLSGRHKSYLKKCLLFMPIRAYLLVNPKLLSMQALQKSERKIHDSMARDTLRSNLESIEWHQIENLWADPMPLFDPN